ncbi:hypothetical protein A3C17_00885 [Candidatus Uhrbacteria bacterium RIFCSPHIGHO2_02_FULL_53_13]|uniref:Uncharacterized protein n=2 Tax=Candidatus Uhriibacteriota TaxID=1752732 RepID=A0A1F7U0Z4_9BACT|nr:MAG: hypothetical protein A3C17_00885 [Candidatus Uhrbacteria bacterium RIFCSPHIGHO2_02_FULL_53_13]OGL90139.1 MAG: hypothetical protein A3I45_00365 [Candidatus Uhrbacteria bacterium RIFCSPLOWO2_02_FULL_53_10]
MRIYLETSSYLPLIWVTPYSKSVVDILEERRTRGDTFELQRDCIAEASGYLSFKDDWRYHPALRVRTLVKNLDENALRALPFPSTAVQLLLGGNIWPQAQYLNFVRHTAFFFIDLLDDILFDNPKEALLAFAGRIEERIISFRTMFARHESVTRLELPTKDTLPYWGKWYLPELPRSFDIKIVDDPRPYNLVSDKLRDIYHYDCAVNASERPDEMVVANTGFKRNVQSSFKDLLVPLICAKTATSEFFGIET